MRRYLYCLCELVLMLLSVISGYGQGVTQALLEVKRDIRMRCMHVTVTN